MLFEGKEVFYEGIDVEGVVNAHDGPEERAGRVLPFSGPFDGGQVGLHCWGHGKRPAWKQTVI